MKQKNIDHLVRCVGDGTIGAGCGYVIGQSGGVCKCGGMLLSDEALKEAEILAQSKNLFSKEHKHEDRSKN